GDRGRVCRSGAGRRRDCLAARCRPHRGGRVQPGGRPATGAAAPDDRPLLPVPAALLERGPNDPDTVAWLAAHWGTQRLRRVEERPGRPGRRLPSGHAAIGYGFFTEGETPQAAIIGLTSRWPELRVVLRPVPPD